MTPHISVIIPAYHAHETIARAVASIRNAGVPMAQVQVVIAPDDGQDYTYLAGQAQNITIVTSAEVRSGAGPARNRALQAAKADYVAFLDADDTWEDLYLAELLPLAQKFGAAFGSTSILDQGQEILRLPLQNSLSFADFARSGASFHPVVSRMHAGPFINRPSQDIMHSLEVVALYGNAVPVSQAAYQLHLNPLSTTADSNFSRRATAAYEAYVQDIRLGKTRIPAVYHEDTVAVFHAKSRLNRAYTDAGGTQSYYQFIAAMRPC